MGTSDRRDLMTLLESERVHSGFQLGQLRSWDALKLQLQTDLKFLEDKGFIDYSLLMHGLLFQSATDEALNESFDAAVKKYPCCAAGCSQATGSSRTCIISCVSVIDYLLPFSAWNHLENAASTLVYGTLKWTNYRERLETLL